MKNMSNCCCL